MKLDIRAICHKGLVRQNNQDAISIGGILLRDDSASLSVTVPQEGYFYLLASDGMGGHENGEQASFQTLEGMNQFFLSLQPPSSSASPEGIPHYASEQIPASSAPLEGIPHYASEQIPASTAPLDDFDEALRRAVRDISCRLNDQAAAEGQVRPMGCTLSGVIWYNGTIRLINAGDSRVYRVRGGIARQLTTDDNERGITGNPHASKLLLNCIGGGAEGRLDIRRLDGKLRPGDILLICTDGLSDMVDTEQFESLLGDPPGLSEDAPERLTRNATDLLRMACEKGGIDNISIILARILA